MVDRINKELVDRNKFLEEELIRQKELFLDLFRCLEESEEELESLKGAFLAGDGALAMTNRNVNGFIPSCKG